MYKITGGLVACCCCGGGGGCGCFCYHHHEKGTAYIYEYIESRCLILVILTYCSACHKYISVDA